MAPPLPLPLPLPLCAAAAALALLGAGPARAQGGPPFLPPLQQRLLVPSLGVAACYDPSDPAHGACACAWDQLVSDTASRAYSALGAVVISPGSPAAPGPGATCNAGFLANVTLRMQAADPNVPVLGLVPVAFGQRPLAAAIADMDAYVRCYAPPLVAGFILWEAPSDCAAAPFVSALAAHARAALGGANPAAPPTQVVLDAAGQPGAECLLAPGLADVIVTFRGDYSAYEAFEPAPWHLAHNATRFAHVVTGAAFVDGAADSPHLLAIIKSKSSNAGFVYVTNVTGDSSFGILPSPYIYWDQELRWARNIV